MVQEKSNGKIVAEVVVELITSQPTERKTAIGLGGPHYCPNFTKVIVRTEYAIGHICPKHQLQNLDENMLMQAIQKTIPKPDLVILDWKGLSGEKERIIKLLEKQKIRSVKINTLI